MSKDQHSFRVYIDESGDEGFKFPLTPGGQGSSEWLVMSAVIFKAENELAEVKRVDEAKQALNRPMQKPLHFSHLSHEQKVVYSGIVSKASVVAVNVAVYKPELTERRAFQKPGILYNFASKLLLERV